MSALPQDWDGAWQQHDLLTRFAAGDSAAFAEIYDLYAQRLYTYANSRLHDAHLAADVVHDTFLLAQAKIGQLRDPNRFGAWLYAICRNECNSVHRMTNRERPTDDVPDSVELPPDTAGDAAAAVALVSASIASLGDGDREVMELSVQHDLDITQIAAVLGVSENNARARVSRARGVLAEAVAAQLLLTESQDCQELNGLRRLNADGTIELTPLTRKRVTKHVRKCPRCQTNKSRALKAIATVTLPMLLLPLWLRDATLSDAQLTSAALTLPHEPALDRTGFPRQAGAGASTGAKTVIGLAGAAVVAAGAMVGLNTLSPANTNQPAVAQPVVVATGSSGDSGAATPVTRTVPHRRHPVRETNDSESAATDEQVYTEIDETSDVDETFSQEDPTPVRTPRPTRPHRPAPATSAPDQSAEEPESTPTPTPTPTTPTTPYYPGLPGSISSPYTPPVTPPTTP